MLLSGAAPDLAGSGWSWVLAATTRPNCRWDWSPHWYAERRVRLRNSSGTHSRRRLSPQDCGGDGTARPLHRRPQEFSTKAGDVAAAAANLLPESLARVVTSPKSRHRRSSGAAATMPARIARQRAERNRRGSGRSQSAGRPTRQPATRGRSLGCPCAGPCHKLQNATHIKLVLLRLQRVFLPQDCSVTAASRAVQ